MKQCFTTTYMEPFNSSTLVDADNIYLTQWAKAFLKEVNFMFPGRAYILNQLREKKVRVTMSDILTLQKAAFLMYGGPTESIAFDFTGLGGTGMGQEVPPVTTESVAVKQARESGDKSRYLTAIQDDLSEQQALIEALMSDEDAAK